MLVGKPEGKRSLEDLGVDGSIILEWILGKWGDGADWIQLAQDRDEWPAVVNTAMNFRVP
jgi:hypothetical protein